MAKNFNENIVKTLKRLYNHIEDHYERNKIERIDVLNNLVKEIDFVCNLGNKRYYVQSALNLETREKTIQEEKTLMNINDNFKKIIVVKANIKHWYTEEGILVIGVQEFLLNQNSLDL